MQTNPAHIIHRNSPFFFMVVRVASGLVRELADVVVCDRLLNVRNEFGFSHRRIPPYILLIAGTVSSRGLGMPLIQQPCLRNPKRIEPGRFGVKEKNISLSYIDK